jgi:UDP-N-acetylmuramyl pentapeptide phosphotransferase/UDP-N-acetylglucosamine-1-phosphate transferase
MGNILEALPMGLKLAIIVSSALISAALIMSLRPLLRRYALARPNARSSHAVPTPQGGGIAVVLAVLLVLGGVAGMSEPFGAAQIDLRPLAAAILLLAAIGAADDILNLPVLPRLAAQAVAVGAVVMLLPAQMRVLPAVPITAERWLEIVAGLWFVNLTNFMDGIDWMTVAETVPVTAAVFLFGLFGAGASSAGLVALALCGAMLGFAPFNRPVAKLFLGDVGSLPIGLILFWLLLMLAGRGHLAAALLLPLYYLADATITLLLRCARGERITQAHRSHFYQRATARGFSVPAVVRMVFATNVALTALAALSIWASSVQVDIALLICGAALVATLLHVMARGPGRTKP